MFRQLTICLGLVLVVGDAASVEARSEQPAFRQQWYDQGAEITRYALEQSRYGEVREGDAVLIYVTEPLDLQDQVKSDDPDAATAVAGLKLNSTRSFLTGIYPYSVMRTILQPIDGDPVPRGLKVTASIQEWCGQVFEQWNRREDGGWTWRTFSYFQSEGDRQGVTEAIWLEDELWTRIRLDPASLPVGRFQLITGAVHRRLQHRPVAALAAQGSWREEGDRRHYQVSSPERVLTLTIGREFPYRLEAWTERAGDQVTRATATHRIHLPYWRYNDDEDRSWRAELGLPVQQRAP